MDITRGAAELRYAGFWRRFTANLVDGILISVVLVTWLLLAIFAFGPQLKDPGRAVSEEEIEAFRQKEESHQRRQTQIVGWVGNAVGFVYVIAFWTWRGQTPGKMALGVRIVKADGNPIGFGRAVLRYIGQVVSTIILFIGFLMIAWDRRKQGLHDKIAGTCVVRT